jgi:hypothetical protein
VPVRALPDQRYYVVVLLLVLAHQFKLQNTHTPIAKHTKHIDPHRPESFEQVSVLVVFLHLLLPYTHSALQGLELFGLPFLLPLLVPDPLRLPYVQRVFVR